jgi:LysR family transcriptional activator of nhaA
MHNYNHLFYFFICAHFKNISKAATHLKTSQPSLSIQIKTLEENLDMKLFIRNGRSIELTTSGKILFSFCEKMFSETQLISDFIKTKSLNKRENISIGVSEQIERPYIADILGKLIKKFKLTEAPKIRMQTISSSEMISLLKIDKMDLVVTHKRFNAPNLEMLVLDMPIALVGLKKIIYAEHDSNFKIKTFFKNYHGGLVAPIETFKLRSETDMFFSNHNLPQDIVFESGNLSANIRVISEGLGIGFMPIIYTIKEIINGKLAYYMPDNGIWRHSIFVYYSKKSLEKKSIIELLGLFSSSLDIDISRY